MYHEISSFSPLQTRLEDCLARDAFLDLARHRRLCARRVLQELEKGVTACRNAVEANRKGRKEYQNGKCLGKADFPQDFGYFLVRPMPNQFCSLWCTFGSARPA